MDPRDWWTQRSNGELYLRSLTLGSLLIRLQDKLDELRWHRMWHDKRCLEEPGGTKQASHFACIMLLNNEVTALMTERLSR